jgi:hypothetical protein
VKTCASRKPVIYWFQNGGHGVSRGEDTMAIGWDDPKQYQQDGETEEEFLSRIETASDRNAWRDQDA